MDSQVGNHKIEKTTPILPEAFRSAPSEESTDRRSASDNRGTIQASEESLAEDLAKRLRLPFVKLGAISIDQEVLRLIPQGLARKHGCIAYKRSSGTATKAIMVAMANPNDIAAQQELAFATGSTILPAVATSTEIADAIAREYSSDQWVQDFLSLVDEGHMQILTDEEAPTDIRSATGAIAPVVKLLNLIIQQGIREQASDIHIEPTHNHLQVRGRVQGLLKEFLHVPKWLQEPVISRLKILSNLDITDRRRPQDGRIKVIYEGNEIDLRVSTLPTQHGEKAVLRILGTGTVPSTQALGLGREEIEILKRATDQPQGMILVTGPTGSGKTTTLYSVMNEKRAPSINIVTVEDPIEIQLPGINQVQVNTKAGLTFASSLRSILRQDPDVILVGEIRDLETAEIAIHASQTGHLVLSTLHTNSTVATITRLLDLGIDPYLASTSLNLIMAQRLVRELCEHCKEQYQPAPNDLERLHLGNFTDPIYRSKGCSKCDQTGYKGRIGLYEVLRITPAIRALIASKANEAELRKGASEGGTIPLIESAIQKIKNGQTSIEEVLRVVQVDEEDVPRCPSCRAIVETKFASCPYCHFALRRNCSSCSIELKPEWTMCPYCSTPAGDAPRPPKMLDVSEPATSNLDSSQVHAELTQPQPRILIVDDDPVMREMLLGSLSLLETHPEVREAVNGALGLESALEWKPDLVITDVDMPLMNGFELCKGLRSDVSTAFTPILMLTVNRDELNRTKGYMVGTDDYMGKPFSVPELNLRVSRLLRRTYGY